MPFPLGVAVVLSAESAFLFCIRSKKCREFFGGLTEIGIDYLIDLLGDYLRSQYGGDAQIYKPDEINQLIENSRNEGFEHYEEVMGELGYQVYDKREIELKDKKIEDLKKEIEELKKNRDTNEEIERLQSKSDELQNKIDELERKLKSYDSDKDVEIRELRKKKEELEADKKELEDNLNKCQKQKDIGYDPDDPYNLCKPYKGGKSRMKVSKPGQRPKDILDGFAMNAQCCATMADGFEKIARSIKSNQFIGQSANIQAVTSVTVTSKPVTINEVEISKIPKEIPNYKVSSTITEIPNIQKETQVTKIPNFEQANLDFNKFVEAINKLDSTVKNDLTKSIKNDLVKAVRDILFSNSSTDTTAKNNLKKVLTTLTKKGSYNPSTNSSGILTGSYTPLELQAMKDKAELQHLNDENNFDIDIDDIIMNLFIDFAKNQPQFMDMLQEINKLSRKP